MSEQEIERELTDSDGDVRWAFARRTDLTPTPEQVERGLTDSAGCVRRAFENRQTEWRAKWEAHELKKRHVQTIALKVKLEAL
jgi:hypothetical protein